MNLFFQNRLFDQGPALVQTWKKHWPVKAGKILFQRWRSHLKEARETNYWLRLLRDSQLCDGIDYTKLINESEEIIKILTSIVKTSQKKN